MDLDPVLLSRLQFAFVVSFHIIFPAFTIGLAAWLATIEGARLATGNPLYRRVFDFWLKVFALSFGMGVVTGIVMAFQFGTNWSVLSQRMGSIQGPLLGYEAFTAFLLEATFFGVMLLGRERVRPGFYFFACCMVALGTMFSSFWILANNSWMQVPVGHAIVDGKIIPADWWAITTGPIQRVRWPHMLLAAFLTTGMSVVATGAWYVLRGIHRTEARVMLHWGLRLVAVLIPVQLFFGHLTGEYVHDHQPEKFAAIEARWQTQQPATEVLFAIPDPANERNLFAVEVPKLGSFIASGKWDSREVGLDSFPKADRPPVLIPFFTFRIMVGMGLIMLAISWFGNFLRWRGRLETTRWFLWCAFLSFPTGFVAVLSGWYTAEVGRQPWVVYGLLRTEGCGDTIAHDEYRVVLAACLCCRLRSVRFLRYALHLPVAARGADGRGPTRSRERQRSARSRSPTRPSPLPAANCGSRGERHGAIQSDAVLGRRARVRDPRLRDPGRFRSGRGRVVRHHARGGPSRGDDGFDRAFLGRQRDLARGDRRWTVRGLPGGVRGVPVRVLHPCPAVAVRPDLPRYRLRVPLSQPSARAGCGTWGSSSAPRSSLSSRVRRWAR